MATHALITPHTHPEPGTGRRTLFGVAAALLAGPAVAATGSPASPDAELIQACHDYIAATDAYDTHGGKIEDETQDPYWQRYVAALDRTEKLHPTTMAGLIALAEVAVYEARQPSGEEDFSTSFTTDWPERVVRGVLRVLAGRA